MVEGTPNTGLVDGDMTRRVGCILTWQRYRRNLHRLKFWQARDLRLFTTRRQAGR